MLRKSQLKGLDSKEGRTRLIASLFADDTTVFLHETDSFEDLQNLLTCWCKASGARFNIRKTVVIPLGNKAYREKLVRSRKLNPTGAPIPREVHIAEEAEPIRILGTFVGYNTPQINVWTPILEKIDLNLERWNRGHPTQDGKRLIIGMEVGGRTQYLTRVQGMPSEIEDAISKRISKFMWGETKAPPVSMATLSNNIASGESVTTQ
ncbi:hypothetical protein M378DRAFT_190406 [Amanita muscaria Koide BX008]|uniref:Reverse transcriptase domain-containing protein n=1 Tax=Amanita muscaria (strain Koide BX008) TaxID=946122 RepID=A0A0C2X4K0_AMAMK|nr:hypothetical protein M378DRAFT_190406 [Amanita muscaria Koide BX008]